MKEVTIKLTEKELAEVNKVLGALGKKIVPEEEKTKGSGIPTDDGYTDYDEILITKGMLKKAHLDGKDNFNVFGNDSTLYITDLSYGQIDWGDEEVESCGVAGLNYNGEILFDNLKDFFSDLNPFGGNELTAEVGDRIISITVKRDEDYYEPDPFPPQEFIVATDAEGRATIRKEIFEAANLIDHVDTWFIFTNDDGTKMYITWKSDPYLIFNKEEAHRVKDIERYGKTALRIKLGEPYTKYRVTTTGEEDKEVITIHLDSGMPLEEDEEPSKELDEQIKEYAHKKNEDAKVIENTIKEILTTVEGIKKLTGVDLSEYFNSAIKKILTGTNAKNNN